MLGRLLVFATLAAVPPVAVAVTPPQSQVDVTGSYASNWDDVKLVQDGERVRGTYVCCGGGTIEGRIIEGRTLRYVWRQPGAWGLGVWKIAPNRLDGTWGVQQDEVNGGRWDLVRKKPANQIAN